MLSRKVLHGWNNTELLLLMNNVLTGENLSKILSPARQRFRSNNLNAVICLRRSIRSSMGGRVETRPDMPPPESGLTINIGAVDGFACIGMASDPRLNLSRAPASHKRASTNLGAGTHLGMYFRSRNGHLESVLRPMEPGSSSRSYLRCNFLPALRRQTGR